MEYRPSPENDFFPSTLEHRPLHLPEKVELKKYFAVSGADEYEGFTPSVDAHCTELADFEAWVWGLRLWGRECIIRASVAATQVLAADWEAALERGEGDVVSVAAAYSEILTPAEAASAALFWANVPGEEKAIRIMELEKPLPEEWTTEPLCATLQQRPFYWGTYAGWALMQGILNKRDPAAMILARACCGAARVRMLAGRTPAAAVSEVRERVILALRRWMGHKW